MKKIFSLTTTFLIFISSFTQAQILSSDTTAAPVIFLDFDGHTVSGTSWNYNGPIVCGASGLSAAKIQEVFSRVAEDYRPFTVNVTTDSTKFLAAPILQRMRVLVTVSSAWYGNTGGVSYVSSFSWGDDTPCFVFSQLLAFNVKNISEAISHEAVTHLAFFIKALMMGIAIKFRIIIQAPEMAKSDGHLLWESATIAISHYGIPDQIHLAVPIFKMI